MSMATTIMAPTAKKADTVAIATTANRPVLTSRGLAPVLAANPGAKVLAASGGQNRTASVAIVVVADASLCTAGGSLLKATGSSNEAQPVASSQSRLSRLPNRTCSTSRCTELL